MNVTVTRANAVSVAAVVNEAFYACDVTKVNGRELKARTYGADVAKSWQNGTVSFTVKGQERGKTGEVFVKVGEVVATK